MPATRALLALLACVVFLAGCRSARERDDATAPEIVYDKAHSALVSGDYQNAVRLYETLEARFPFSEQARQGKLDVLYAYYRNRETETAVDAADQFIRENPTHPHVDYAWYVKGLVYFERLPNFLERWFNADLTARPPQDARKSFQAFQTLIQQYPNSPYVHDARQRMVYLRNRLAEYEVHVADYYLRRGAYVAALARAKFCIENYDGAPAVQDALDVTIGAYDGLGLKDMADQSRRVYAMNFPDVKPKREQKSWWQLW